MSTRKKRLLQQKDFEDELLDAETMQESDIVAAEAYIKNTAARLGVRYEDIQIPLTQNVKDLALAVAYERRARLKSGYQPANFRNGECEDVYELKRRVYAKERDRLTAEIGISDLLGYEPEKDAPQSLWCVPMFRG